MQKKITQIQQKKENKNKILLFTSFLKIGEFHMENFWKLSRHKWHKYQEEHKLKISGFYISIHEIGNFPFFHKGDVFPKQNHQNLDHIYFWLMLFEKVIMDDCIQLPLKKIRLSKKVCCGSMPILFYCCGIFRQSNIIPGSHVIFFPLEKNSQTKTIYD